MQRILAGFGITAQATLLSTKAQTTLSQQQTAASGSSGLSGGAIAGIVIGCVVGVALIAVAAFFALRYSKRRQGRRMGSPMTPGKALELPSLLCQSSHSMRVVCAEKRICPSSTLLGEESKLGCSQMSQTCPKLMLSHPRYDHHHKSLEGLL